MQGDRVRRPRWPFCQEHEDPTPTVIQRPSLREAHSARASFSQHMRQRNDVLQRAVTANVISHILRCSSRRLVILKEKTEINCPCAEPHQYVEGTRLDYTIWTIFIYSSMHTSIIHTTISSYFFLCPDHRWMLRYLDSIVNTERIQRKLHEALSFTELAKREIQCFDIL